MKKAILWTVLYCSSSWVIYLFNEGCSAHFMIGKKLSPHLKNECQKKTAIYTVGNGISEYKYIHFLTLIFVACNGK